MKKRIVSFLMALVMMTSLLPVQVFAADVDTPAAEPAAVAQEPAKDEEPAQEDPVPVDDPQQGDDKIDTPAEPEQQTANQNTIAVQAATKPAQVNGVYQIKTADELLWFRDFSNKSSGRSANAVLCNDIDMSSVSDWKTPIGKSSTYKGVFDGNGYKILNLTYKPTQTTGAGRALFGKVDSIGVIRNLGLCNANIAAETSAQSDTHVAVLVGINNGTIFNCYIASSEVSIKSKATPNAGILCGYNNGTIENCYCINSSITDANTKSTITGDLGGIAGGNKGTVKNAYAANITISTKGTQNLHPIAVGNVENVYYIKASDDTRTYTGGIEKDAVWFQSEAAVTALGAEYFTQDAADTNGGYPVLTFAKMAVEVVDKSELEKALAAFPTDGYYTQNDRYNGRCTSANGFWSDYQKLTAGARTVLGNENATADEVAKAVNALQDSADDIQAAIANLIPASQANTTVLYEALQSTPASNDGTYTTKSWTAYKTVRDKAEALMASMFHNDGSPNLTNNKAEKQAAIETLAAELKAASKKLDAKGASTSQSIVKLQIEAIQYLAKKYDPDKLSGYTAESMAALRDAWTAALALAADTTVSDIGQNEAQAVTQVLRKLRKAIYGLETDAQGEITVKVSVLDTNDVYRGRGTDSSDRNQHIYTGALTLDANASAYDTLNSRGLLAGSRDFTAGDTLVFLNGEMLYDSGMDMYSDLAYTSGEYSAFQSTKLHDGDELTIVWMYPKQILNSSQVGTYSMALYSNPDWFRYSTISAPVEAEAGQPFTVSVTSDNALSFHNGSGSRAVSGASIYRSEAAATADAAATGYVGVNTYAVTDATGKATVTLYNEGYTLLNAFRMDDEGRYTVGASVLVHVTAPSNLSAVKKQLKTELDAVYYDENYPESYFTAEQWQQVQEAYNTAVAAIDTAETSGAAGDAQQKAMQDIKLLQNRADNSNRLNLEKFRRLLNALPDDVTKLDATAEQQIKDLKTCYEAMTGYQRGQLTGKEQKKYDAVVKALSDGLAPAIQRKLTFQQQFDSSIPAADQAALNRMITYLQDSTHADDKYTPEIGGNMQGKLFAYSTRKYVNYGYAYTQITEADALTQDIYACINPDYTAYFLCRDAAVSAGKLSGPGVISGDGWSISDASMTMFVPKENDSNTTRVLGHMTYTANGKQYAIRSVTVSGLETDAAKVSAVFYDTSVYRGRYVTQCNQVIPDTFLRLTTGFDDVTITVTWAPVNADSSEAIAAAKTAAKADLAAELAKYKHSDANYNNIKNAHDDGVKAIDKASTLAAITKAKASALSEMRIAASGGYIGAAIKGWSQGDPFDAGDQVGTVTVSVANFTYDDGYFYRKASEKPFLYLENYPLGEKDSVMTVILRALKDNGYSWNGSTGNDKNKGEDYGITYLSSVSKTENGKTYSLGEFDGGGQSGWMGTLNDWFTNYGFTEFTVKNRSLGDGDYISIQYTQDGLGADLGGTWDNSDTTLKALKIEGGTLVSKFVPGEAGGTYEYTLAIDSDAAEVRLTPTASNKNFLTKIFLNNKVTDNTEGASFYKRTQYIPVTSGDVIYVGCGERAWPSMNNQEGNTQSNDGTWYALRVVNVKGDAGAVNDMIDALPSASAVKYSSYQQFVDAVAAARTVYNTLDNAAKKAVDPAKLAKLEELEKTIEGFQAIDDVKDKLDKLPNAGGLTIDDQEAVKAAQEAYDKLTDDQKEYLSGSQIDKMEKVTNRMEEIIKENPTPTPTPGGNGGSKKPSQSTGKDVKSGNTGDAGITLYLGMGLVAVLAGAVIVIRKRKEN